MRSKFFFLKSKLAVSAAVMFRDVGMRYVLNDPVVST